MTRESPTREELIAQLWVGIKTQTNEPVMALETSYTYEDYRQDSDTSDVTQSHQHSMRDRNLGDAFRRLIART